MKITKILLTNGEEFTNGWNLFKKTKILLKWQTIIYHYPNASQETPAYGELFQGGFRCTHPYNCNGEETLSVIIRGTQKTSQKAIERGKHAHHCAGMLETSHETPSRNIYFKEISTGRKLKTRNMPHNYLMRPRQMMYANDNPVYISTAMTNALFMGPFIDHTDNIICKNWKEKMHWKPKDYKFSRLSNSFEITVWFRFQSFRTKNCS